MLPGSNKATLNKDFTTKAVIILFKTTAVLLVEVDLPTLFLKRIHGGRLRHSSKADNGD